MPRPVGQRRPAPKLQLPIPPSSLIAPTTSPPPPVYVTSKPVGGASVAQQRLVDAKGRAALRSTELTNRTHMELELGDATDSELREMVAALLPTVADRNTLVRVVRLLASPED
mmetsp:Transcript_4975/g.8199  ORF Transcript_4975/g.8199 Transcript_4975/m.8199 type:complete len:113 (+) Transcript_4975:529-867(+)